MDIMTSDINSRIDELMALLDNVDIDIHKYRGTSVDLIYMESIDKIRRYGVAGYQTKFITDQIRNNTCHIQSFLYLKSMEDMLANTKQMIISELDQLTGQ